MALHAPAHQLGTTPHPHILRNTLAVLAVAALAVALAVGTMTIRVTPAATTTTVSMLGTPQMIQFRASERAAYPAAVDARLLGTPAMIGFRASERAEY